jgi:hypothetical protein
MTPTYSIKQIKKLTRNGKKYLTGKVVVDLSELYDGHDAFLDTISERLTGTELLMDISYSVIKGEGLSITLEVSGDASAVLECSS